MDDATKKALVEPLRKRTNRLVSELTQRIRDDDRPPHVARFGDGEIFCCLDEHRLVQFPENCDYHPYSTELAVALVNAVRTFTTTPHLWLGNWHYWPFGMWIHGLVDSFGGQRAWCSHNIFMHIRTLPLVPVRNLYLAIRESRRRKVLIGPPVLAKLRAFFGNVVYIEVPAVNGWASFDDVRKRCVSSVGRDDLVLIAFGMPGKSLMAALLGECPDAVCLDVGSGLDPMASDRRTRPRHQPDRTTMQKLYGDLLP